MNSEEASYQLCDSTTTSAAEDNVCDNVCSDIVDSHSIAHLFIQID